MKNCKYVTVDNQHIYLFPMHIAHKDMYRGVKQCHLDGFELSESWECTGAGFVEFKFDTDEGVVANCYGESISLDIKSNPETDNILANRLLGRDSF